MSTIDESTLMVLKQHKEQLKELLAKFDDFFTEISITGLASLANKEGFQKIKKMTAEFQKIGLESTALLLEQFLQELQQATTSSESKNNATFLLNRLLTWQLVFSRQFDYLTAGTAVIAEKEEVTLVETGEVEATVDLTLVPFSVEVLNQTKTQTSLAISCLEIETGEIYTFKDVLARVERSSSGPLKVNSQFFGGFNWDYTAALNKIIILENVIVEQINPDTLKFITSPSVKCHSIRKTITTRTGELERESTDAILEKLDELAIIHQVTPDKLECLPNKIITGKDAFKPGKRSDLWRFAKIVHNHIPYVIISRKKKGNLDLTGIFLPKTRRFAFPAIERLPVSSFGQDLSEKGELDQEDPENLVKHVLLDPNLVKSHAGSLLKRCEELTGLPESNHDSHVLLELFLITMLLTRKYIAIPAGLKETMETVAVRELQKPKVMTNEQSLANITARLLLGELLSREEIDNLIAASKKIRKPLKRARSGKAASGTSVSIAKIDNAVNKLFHGKQLEQQEKNAVIKEIMELAGNLTATKGSIKLGNSLQELAMGLELLRHEIPEILHREMISDLLFSLHYLCYVQETGNITLSRGNLVHLCESIYLLKGRSHPRVFS